MALYIIFLGIVPMVALSSFGIWYVRNPGQHWKKSMMSTYVSSLDRVTEKCKPHAFSSRGARRANSSHRLGKNFYERVVIFFSPRQENSRNSDRIFTISDNLPPKEKLQITKTDLISTTNPDAINCSNSIAKRKSMLLSNMDQSVSNKKPDVSESDQSAQPSSVEGQARKNSIRTELGTKIAERIQQMQKKPTKNIKGLTLKTEVKFEHLNESSSGSVGVTPKTGEPLLPDGKPYSKAPAPFYNKKPPPPPAPAQSLKPKI